MLIVDQVIDLKKTHVIFFFLGKTSSDDQLGLRIVFLGPAYHLTGFSIGNMGDRTSIDDIESRYYIRIEAPDKPGVLANISGVFAKEKVSIEAVVQRETVKDTAQIVIILNENKEKSIQRALKKLAALPVVKKVSNVIRVGLE